MKRFEQPLELRCGACGKVGKYKIGRLLIDPTLMPSEGGQAVNQAFGFSAYIHCKRCQAGGPWELTANSQLQILAQLVMARMKPKESQIHLVMSRLFDGTVSRWPTQAEAHYRQLLEKDPGNYFVWNRLGNIYKTGDVPELALEAYHKALELNEHDIESLHSIAQVYFDRDEPEKAAEYFHRVLLHARHAPKQIDPELVRGIVEDSLMTLSGIHQDSGKRIPFFPPEIEVEAPDKPGPKRAYMEFDLSEERDQEKLIDWFMTGKPPVPPARGGRPARPAPRTQPQRRVPPPEVSRHVGRNDPCPCGSGRKFKNCCLRA